MKLIKKDRKDGLVRTRVVIILKDRKGRGITTSLAYRVRFSAVIATFDGQG